MTLQSPRTSLHAVPGSFRDPSGHVFTDADGHVYRTIHQNAKENFDAVSATGVFDALMKDGWLVSHSPCDMSQFEGVGDGVACVLHHEAVPFVSFPYEWSFGQLRAAALLHLDVHLCALDHGCTLSDATAYNIQFIGGRPVFIDTLSFIPYREGMLWAGQRQFVEQFVTPLLLWAYRGVAPHAWYRGTLTGIPGAELNRLLPWWRKCSLAYFSHVFLQQWFESRQSGGAAGGEAVKARPLPKEALRFMLRQLRRWVERLPAPRARGHWRHYVASRSYSAAALDVKGEFVRRAVESARPAQLWDIGCNTGEYSALALEAGAGCVVGFESDTSALELAAARAKDGALPFLPLYMDICSPSPASGWAQQERPGLLERRKADFVLALAVLHHMVIGSNVPLPRAVGFLLSLAGEGIVEWVPKSDVMVRRMLANREDIFADYTREAFLSCLGEQAEIVAEQELSEGGRLLVHYRRKEEKKAR